MVYYDIRVQGHLSSQWDAWFDGMVITRHANGETSLCGNQADQAALFGTLVKISNLGLNLISVNQIESEKSVAPIEEN